MVTVKVLPTATVGGAEMAYIHACVTEVAKVAPAISTNLKETILTMLSRN